MLANYSPSKETFSKNLKFLIEKKHEGTLKSFAEKCGMNLPRLLMYLNEKQLPNGAALLSISRALQVTPFKVMSTKEIKRISTKDELLDV